MIKIFVHIMILRLWTNGQLKVCVYKASICTVKSTIRGVDFLHSTSGHHRNVSYDFDTILLRLLRGYSIPIGSQHTKCGFFDPNVGAKLVSNRHPRSTQCSSPFFALRNDKMPRSSTPRISTVKIIWTRQRAPKTSSPRKPEVASCDLIFPPTK